MRDLSRQGINPQRLDVDWGKIGEDQRQQAIRDVKGSLILDYIAEKEKIDVNDDEVEAEIDKIATETNNPRRTGQGSADARIRTWTDCRSQIRNKKTLDFLQEHARHSAGRLQTNSPA